MFKALGKGEIQVWREGDQTVIHHQNGLTITLNQEEEAGLLAWLQNRPDMEGLATDWGRAFVAHARGKIGNAGIAHLDGYVQLARYVPDRGWVQQSEIDREPHAPYLEPGESISGHTAVRQVGEHIFFDEHNGVCYLVATNDKEHPYKIIAVSSDLWRIAEIEQEWLSATTEGMDDKQEEGLLDEYAAGHARHPGWTPTQDYEAAVNAQFLQDELAYIEAREEHKNEQR